MDRLKIYPTSINSRHIERTVGALREGEIIAYPTDTVYALGCDALSQRAVERLCAIKGINPAKESLSVVCSDLSMAAQYARIDNRAFRIIKQNAPGPFTFILPVASTLPKIFKGRRTVGIRIPDNPISTALAESLGNPILSASIFSAGEEEILTADQIELIPGLDVSVLVDSGQELSEFSTIVDLTDSSAPEIIRQGKAELM